MIEVDGTRHLENASAFLVLCLFGKPIQRPAGKTNGLRKTPQARVPTRLPKPPLERQSQACLQSQKINNKQTCLNFKLSSKKGGYNHEILVMVYLCHSV
ncbi:hypothetical protein D0469_10840 [Peribacillus saganii]|uniref:Uncharacterized protein n=1 Tax=Peribacillus saganii TaxID=2303992 RepID=A0A372LNB7_9BACI|nr:hypothetical protein D0469_10840 [Peribacillus saganii]